MKLKADPYKENKLIFRLDPGSFERITSSDKKYVYWINDKRAKRVSDGSVISLINNENKEKIKVRVEDIYKAKNFSELRANLMKMGLIDYKDLDTHDLLQRFNKNDVWENGVVALKIEPLKEKTEEEKEKEKFFYRAPMIIAEYMYEEISKEKAKQGYWICGTALGHCIKEFAYKLNLMFTSEALVPVAYYIQFLNKRIDKEDFEKEVSKYQCSLSDIEQLYLCMMKLPYRVIGIHKRSKYDYQ